MFTKNDSPIQVPSGDNNNLPTNIPIVLVILLMFEHRLIRKIS